jgi:PAS domain S-box-containing protein
MAETPEHEAPLSNRQSSIPTAFLQRSGDAIFLMNRQRRLVFVNRAWEELTGRPAGEMRGLACKRHANPVPSSPEELVSALVAPPEVLAGQTSRARRLIPCSGGKSRWCDLDFLPLHDEKGVLAVLGKITPAPPGPAPPPMPQVDALVALRAAHAERYRYDYLTSSQVAGSAPLRQVVDQARLASQTRVPVLITGEPGTGKQWVARTIHYQSAARETAFVALDCAHLPPGVLANLLFGAGGLVWRADMGTLYFQEPDRLPRDLQDRLIALAGDSPVRSPRLMAGVELPEGRQSPLRDDLLCALGTVRLEMPPLRNRPAADLPWLVERLLVRATGAALQPPGSQPTLTPEAWELVYTYRWPGNLRELYTVLAGACAHAAVGPAPQRIDVANLPPYLRLATVSGEKKPSKPLPLHSLLEQAERRLITLALRRTQGNKTKAADLLSIWRPLLLRRMKKLGITDVEE